MVPPSSGPSRIRIAVDAMGGDEAPANIVEGVIDATRRWGDRLEPVLIGVEPRLREELDRFGAGDLGLEIVHAEQTVGMGEGGADSARRKKDSSLAVATRMVRKDEARAVFSAGNTGGMVAASLLNIGRIPGVHRPAIATLVPTEGDPHWLVMLDVGATADCKAENLLQFAILGEVYARILLAIPRPRVGLLNIGEEPSKGSELAQEAYPLLTGAGLNFVGNVEGKDLLRGRADVVVTDGFTGNVLLKFAESVLSWGFDAVRREIGEHVLAKMGAYLLRPSLRRFKNKMDYTEYGGAPLLGVDGVAIIGHGRSNAKAVRNALRMAGDLVERGITDEIRRELARVKGGKVVNS